VPVWPPELPPPELPPPHAAWNNENPSIRVTIANDAKRRRCFLPAETVAKNIPGIISPNARSKPELCRTHLEAAARDAAADAVRIAVAVPFATVIDPMAHVGAGVAVGVMLQVKVTPEALKPFVGAIVIVEVADWPSETEDGVIADVERLKSAVMLTALEVLILKLPSPEYAAVIV